MMTDDELKAKVEQLCGEYEGRIDEFYEAVGLVAVGRLMGWKVMRLVAPRKHWKTANDIFGDLKELLPERGIYAERSQGLKIIDKLGHYWEYVRGTEQMPIEQRKSMQ